MYTRLGVALARYVQRKSTEYLKDYLSEVDDVTPVKRSTKQLDSCSACGALELVRRTVTARSPSLKGKTCEFIICPSCSFISNPGNVHDYSALGFDDASSPDSSPRTGDGQMPKREYHMAQMGADILARHSPGQDCEVVVFGAGLSKDHALIADDGLFSRVAVCDMENFQAVADFVPHTSRDVQFDAVIACEVIEHFTDLDADFDRLFGKMKDTGLVIASTNICDGAPLHTLLYPFALGHTAYHSGRSLLAVCERFGMQVDFRTPAISFNGAGPRKRYVLFYKDPRIGECISQYFADHHVAPSE